jgi:RNA polymerase sigma-70 factor (ECF subfamily)
VRTILPSQAEFGALVELSGALVELFAFDKAYVELLRDGDPPTEQHFVSYFDQLLRIKLRARMLAAEVVNELRQETFIRVIAALRKEGGIREPERLGAFVNSICNNVLLEYYRSSTRSQPLEDHHLESTGKVLDLEGLLVTKELNEHIHRVLHELPDRDRRLLCAMFLEEKDKDQVCREFGVDRDYLRVLFHRAKDKFRALFEKDRKEKGVAAGRSKAIGNV